MLTRRILEKISWRTRRWNIKFHLLNLYFHDGDESWGFNFFTFCANFKFYSLLSFEFRLPNKTTVKRFTVDDWDFLFLYNPLWNRCDDLSERKLWGSRLTRWEQFQLSVLDTIFK
jgi:hypothetical protein